MTKTTSKLLSDLKQMDSYEDFRQTNSAELVVPDVIKLLLEMAMSNGLTKAELVQTSGLERTFGYHLLSGEKTMTRDKLLLFAFAGKLNLEQTQQLLKYAGLGMLYARDKRDGVLIYALNKHYSVYEMEKLLEDLGLDLPLGTEKSGK